VKGNKIRNKNNATVHHTDGDEKKWRMWSADNGRMRGGEPIEMREEATDTREESC
jgi:hypothetical protein